MLLRIIENFEIMNYEFFKFKNLKFFIKPKSIQKFIIFTKKKYSKRVSLNFFTKLVFIPGKNPLIFSLFPKDNETIFEYFITRITR